MIFYKTKSKKNNNFIAVKLYSRYERKLSDNKTKTIDFCFSHSEGQKNNTKKQSKSEAKWSKYNAVATQKLGPAADIYAMMARNKNS